MHSFRKSTHLMRESLRWTVRFEHTHNSTSKVVCVAHCIGATICIILVCTAQRAQCELDLSLIDAGCPAYIKSPLTSSSRKLPTMPSIIIGIEHLSATGFLLTLAAIAIRDSGIRQSPVPEANTVRILFSTRAQTSASLERTGHILKDLISSMITMKNSCTAFLCF